MIKIDKGWRDALLLHYRSAEKYHFRQCSRSWEYSHRVSVPLFLIPGIPASVGVYPDENQVTPVGSTKYGTIKKNQSWADYWVLLRKDFTYTGLLSFLHLFHRHNFREVRSAKSLDDRLHIGDLPGHTR